MFLAWLAACTGSSGTKTTGESGTGDCEVLEDRTCGMGAHSGDTGCPDGYACWGPSAFQCFRGDCDLPICLPPSTRIDTPEGSRAVSSLALGDLVYTLGSDGAVVAAPVVRVGSVRAPPGHQVVHLVLADGREVSGSPGHPTADGRTLGELRAGDLLDQAPITSAQRVPYQYARTWDLRPAGETGAYWADGVLLGSTLSEP
ncbi:MAG: Hint domain-containing protein [Myxococcota bacterium]